MKLTGKRKIEIGALLVVLIAVVTAVLIIGAGKEEKSGVIEASPYSIVWEKEGKSVMRIELSGAEMQNMSWSIMTNDGVIQAEQDGDEPVFRVKAIAEGDGIMTVSMRENGIPVERGADFSFRFAADGKKRISLSSAAAKALTADMYSGDSGGCVYWRSSSSGSLFIYLTGTDWQIELAAGVTCMGPTTDGDISRIELVGNKKAVTGSVNVIDKTTGRGFGLSLIQQDGKLELLKCAEVTAAKTEPEEEPDPEYQAMKDAVEQAATDKEKDSINAAYWNEQAERFRQSYAESMGLTDGQTDVNG